MKKNYLSEISREGLAASLDISPSHLGRFFKKHTGNEIGEYINILRIRDAEKMLRESDDKVIDIALSVGFENLSTFSDKKFFNILLGP